MSCVFFPMVIIMNVRRRTCPLSFAFSNSNTRGRDARIVSRAGGVSNATLHSTLRAGRRRASEGCVRVVKTKQHNNDKHQQLLQMRRGKKKSRHVWGDGGGGIDATTRHLATPHSPPPSPSRLLTELLGALFERGENIRTHGVSWGVLCDYARCGTN